MKRKSRNKLNKRKKKVKDVKEKKEKKNQVVSLRAQTNKDNNESVNLAYWWSLENVMNQNNEI